MQTRNLNTITHTSPQQGQQQQWKSNAGRWCNVLKSLRGTGAPHTLLSAHTSSCLTGGPV